MFNTRSEAVRRAAREYAKRMRAEGRNTRRGSRYLLSRKLAKVAKRAREIGVPFDLRIDDIEVPAECPVLGIPLSWDHPDSTPSLDRINQTGGYTRENVRVISFRANTLRSNANMYELLEVALDAVHLHKGHETAQKCADAIRALIEDRKSA